MGTQTAGAARGYASWQDHRCGLFAADFDQYLYLNLEKAADRKVLDYDLSLRRTLQAIYFLKNGDPSQTSTLLFIDEIQNSAAALSLLRYFHEEVPELPVIAAGKQFRLLSLPYFLCDRLDVYLDWMEANPTACLEI